MRLKFMRHRLFFDVTELAGFDKGTGIQRVTRALLHVLRQKTPADWKVIAVRGDSAKGHFVTATALAERQLAGTPDPSVEIAVEPASGDIFLSVDLAYNITPSLRREIARFRQNGVGVFFVVYDLIPLMYPEWFEGTNAWFEGNDYLKLFRFWFQCVSEESDGMICISDAVRKDVISWLQRYPAARRDQPKIEYFHLGSDITESLPSHGLPVNAREVLDQLVSSTTFLMVGTLEPRKGHELALDAIEKLWAEGQDVKLVFVGRAGWKIEHLTERIKHHPELNRRLYWLDGISDEYLREVYMASSALFALSLAEGFGLPLVEAAHFKLPLIVRDIPVFREICGNAATYFSGTSGDEFKGLLVEWLAKWNAGQHLSPDGMQVLSWPDSAKQLMAAIGRMRGNEFFWEAE
ncbi:glycosyltransferase family 4 protein [Burkholderia multivorans]|nr:glycosyltransferase family 1 protein [Burkholderia multivorans]